MVALGLLSSTTLVHPVRRLPIRPPQMAEMQFLQEQKIAITLALNTFSTSDYLVETGLNKKTAVNRSGQLYTKLN